MKKAVMSKEWGEIGFGSSKRNGWAWEVTLYEDGKVYDRRIFDYYSGQGCQAAVDYANEWDGGFTIGGLK